MKKASRMASGLTSLLFGLTLATTSVQADYAIKDGNGTAQTISAFSCGTGGTKICPGYVPMDYTGAQFGVVGNPFYVVASDNNVPLASMTALNAATAISLTGKHSAAVVLTGTWVGTITPQVSVDGTNWINATFYNPTTHTTAATVSANGTYDILGTGGKTQARVILTAYTSGTVTGNIVASSQAPSSNDAQAQTNALIASPIPTGTNSIGTVQPGNTPNTVPWLFQGAAAASGGWTRTLFAALSTTVQTVKGTAGQLGKLYCDNPNTSAIYVETFDVASATTVTLGTTVPTQAYYIPATNAAGFSLPLVGDQYTLGIKIAAVTTYNGSTAPTTPGNCNVSWN